MSTPFPPWGVYFLKRQVEKRERDVEVTDQSTYVALPQNFKVNTKIMIQNYRFVHFFTVYLFIFQPSYLHTLETFLPDSCEGGVGGSVTLFPYES